MNVPPHHPLQELLAKLLFSIETVPPKEQKRMVSRACNKAAEWHKKQIKTAETIIEIAREWASQAYFESIAIDSYGKKFCEDCRGVWPTHENNCYIGELQEALTIYDKIKGNNNDK